MAQSSWSSRRALLWGHERFINDMREHILGARSQVGRLPSENLIQHSTKTVDIRPLIHQVYLTTSLLRGHVGRCTKLRTSQNDVGVPILKELDISSQSYSFAVMFTENFGEPQSMTSVSPNSPIMMFPGLISR